MSTTTTPYDIARYHVERAGGLVTAAMLARRWGVSKERVAQLSKQPDFPPPFPLEGRSQVWLADECDRWRAGR